MTDRPQCCGECAHFNVAHSDCRRYPPVVFDTDGSSAWPNTLREHWCGEFRSRAPAPGVRQVNMVYTGPMAPRKLKEDDDDQPA